MTTPTTPEQARGLAADLAEFFGMNAEITALCSLADQVEALTAQLDSYSMALNETKAERNSYKAELLHVARMAEDLKRECSDPESWQAARNTQYMNISYYARAAIAKGTAA